MDYGKKAPKTPENDDKKMAKMKALKELRSAMSSADGEGLGKAMSKKVTVAAPDNEKLKEGLKVAENMLPDDKGPKVDRHGEDMDAGNQYRKTNDPVEGPNPYANEDHEGSPEEESQDMEDMVDYCETPEQIDEMMKRLQAKKASLK